MIPKECKRLAEVDFPIAVVGRHSLAEKARRMGTPHQLHLWWAWRPLAACRAMLLGLLLPDPCDEHCPEEFKKKARELLPKVPGAVGPKDEHLQQSLLKFIGDFANWELSADRTYLEISRGLVKAAHPQETPFIVDPFAGGGSIPLEALRLGCEAFAGELNSVACLLLKAKLQDIQRHGTDLSEKLSQLGERIEQSAGRELGQFYPADPGGSPIAYLWARTVRCETPNCGAEIPLIRSFWLSKKANRKRAIKYRVARPSEWPPYLEFEIFEPDSDRDVPAGTVTRAKAACPFCNIVLLPDRVRSQLATQRGGADVVFDGNAKRAGGARLLAVVTVKPGEQGRYYRLPNDADYEAVHKAMERLKKVATDVHGGLNPVPDESLPPQGTLGFRVQPYGMTQWGDLFTARQKLALVMLCREIAKLESTEERELLALSLSKLAERNNSICDWMVGVECPGHLYTQQVVPPAWDFAEAAPLCDSSGSFKLSIEHTVTNASACYVSSTTAGEIHQIDAADLTLPDDSCGLFFTDPPYYDAVPYADLSDFFFVWLKRTLPGHTLLRDPFDPQNPLSPKTKEIVQDEVKEVDGRPKDRAFFEERIARAFSEGCRVLKNDGIGCVVFAHKTTEGWEALLSGMIRGGWVITASWPITTERSARMRARESAALAASLNFHGTPFA